MDTQGIQQAMQEKPLSETRCILPATMEVQDVNCGRTTRPTIPHGKSLTYGPVQETASRVNTWPSSLVTPSISTPPTEATTMPCGPTTPPIVRHGECLISPYRATVIPKPSGVVRATSWSATRSISQPAMEAAVMNGERTTPPITQLGKWPTSTAVQASVTRDST